MSLVATKEGRSRLSQRWAPCTALRPYVLSFELRDNDFGDAEVFNPLPARTDCFLQFHLRRPYTVVNTHTREIHPAPTRALVGPHTVRREDILWSGHIKAFTIRFSPVGFRSIFGIPASVLRNTVTSAELVLGSAILSLEARLADAQPHHMSTIAEEFLLTQLARQRSHQNAVPVLRLTDVIQRPNTSARLRQLADAHALGLRTMERLFREFVGVSPKSFERLHRARQALALHRARPNQNWSTIAAASGYFDQAHLIRDFRSMNGCTPGSFARAGSVAHALRSVSSEANGA